MMVVVRDKTPAIEVDEMEICIRISTLDSRGRMLFVGERFRIFNVWKGNDVLLSVRFSHRTTGFLGTVEPFSLHVEL